jgi:hypothetical protein
VEETTSTILWTVWTSIFSIDFNIIESYINYIHIVLVRFILEVCTHSFSVVYKGHSGHNCTLAIWISKGTLIIALVGFEVGVFNAFLLERTVLHEKTVTTLETMNRMSNIAFEPTCVFFTAVMANCYEASINRSRRKVVSNRYVFASFVSTVIGTDGESTRLINCLIKRLSGSSVTDA